MKVYAVNERVRIYHYVDGSEIRFQEVDEVRVSESGHHYLTYDGGCSAIVAPGWRWIDLTFSGEWVEPVTK